jgi:hypothetical protein
MVSFGKKISRGFSTFGKKIVNEFANNNLGRKIANTIKSGSNLIGKVADMASVANPALMPYAQGIKQAVGGVAGLTSTARRAINQGKGNVDEIRAGIERLKPAERMPENAVTFG